MEKHLTKIILAITIMAVVAYVVASAVGKRELMEVKSAQKPKARGDMWQTPVAASPSGNDSYGDMAG